MYITNKLRPDIYSAHLNSGLSLCYINELESITMPTKKCTDSAPLFTIRSPSVYTSGHVGAKHCAHDHVTLLCRRLLGTRLQVLSWHETIFSPTAASQSFGNIATNLSVAQTCQKKFAVDWLVFH